MLTTAQRIKYSKNRSSNKGTAFKNSGSSSSCRKKAIKRR
nr:MAG TPA: hypothetical protein [Caudoviricetes sp.]